MGLVRLFREHIPDIKGIIISSILMLMEKQRKIYTKMVCILLNNRDGILE